MANIPSCAAGADLPALAPRARIAALADDGRCDWLDAPRRSPHLARLGIAATDDDGVVTARVRLHGQPWLVAAQDERFLGGSVGERHGEALQSLFTRACNERPAGVALLAASGGVRLHEANAGELALARALRALTAVRAEGIVTAAMAVNDVFGGGAVLACACQRFAAMPGTRIGLSGPKVVEAARGKAELDARDAAAVSSLYGVDARLRAGQVEAVDAAPAAVAQWLGTLRAQPFADAVALRQAVLESSVAGVAVASPRDLPGDWQARQVAAGLWRRDEAWIVAPFSGRSVHAAALVALDRALLDHVGRGGAPSIILLLEDSHGHEVSRHAEALLLARHLAHHACVLALLRMRGVREVGVLCGTGHSAAFFANALQADALLALPAARVVTMAPEAIARVTGVAASDLVETDPLLGQPVRHFAALGGVAAILDDPTPAQIVAAAR